MRYIEIVKKSFKTFYSIRADESGEVTKLRYTKNYKFFLFFMI